MQFGRYVARENKHTKILPGVVENFTESGGGQRVVLCLWSDRDERTRSLVIEGV